MNDAWRPLGLGFGVSYVLTPTQIGTYDDWWVISTTNRAAHGIRITNMLTYAWGANGHGQLGVGPHTNVDNRPTPTLMAGTVDFLIRYIRSLETTVAARNTEIAALIADRNNAWEQFLNYSGGLDQLIIDYYNKKGQVYDLQAQINDLTGDIAALEGDRDALLIELYGANKDDTNPEPGSLLYERNLLEAEIIALHGTKDGLLTDLFGGTDPKYRTDPLPGSLLYEYNDLNKTLPPLRQERDDLFNDLYGNGTQSAPQAGSLQYEYNRLTLLLAGDPDNEGLRAELERVQGELATAEARYNDLKNTLIPAEEARLLALEGSISDAQALLYSYEGTNGKIATAQAAYATARAAQIQAETDRTNAENARDQAITARDQVLLELFGVGGTQQHPRPGSVQHNLNTALAAFLDLEERILERNRELLSLQSQIDELKNQTHDRNDSEFPFLIVGIISVVLGSVAIAGWVAFVLKGKRKPVPA